MKDKVIKTNANMRIYIVDELNYNDKKYVFGFEVTEDDDLIEERPHSLEVYVEGDSLEIKDIDDFETASIVNNIFISRLASGE